MSRAVLLNCVVLVAAALFVMVHAQSDDPSAPMPGVVDLKAHNFEEKVHNGKHWLVEFYAPWCGWCKRLAPIWKELGNVVGSDKDVVIAKYDATQPDSNDIKTKLEIHGFPTILLLKKDGTNAKFQDDRSVEGLLQFIQTHTGIAIGAAAANKPDEKPAAAQADAPQQDTAKGATAYNNGEVIVLNPSNFDEVVKDTTKHVFVKFYAPWCGHCIRMADAWRDLAKGVAGKDVVIAELDSDQHNELASRYGVRGFPTLKLFTPGDKSGDVAYRGARDVGAFTAFLKTQGASLD